MRLWGRNIDLAITVTKQRVTQAPNIWVMEKAVIHVEQSEKSAINIDQTAGYRWMTEFSITLMLWANLGWSISTIFMQKKECYGSFQLNGRLATVVSVAKIKYAE
jgi:hypothetical protein